MAVVSCDFDKDVLVVNFQPNVENKSSGTQKSNLKTDYPFAWLRDNCQCSECCHPFTRERTFLFRNLDAETKPSNFKLQDDVILIEWPDGHRSPCPLEWLYSHRFEEDNRDSYLNSTELKEFLWTSEDMQNKMQKFDYSKLITDDGVLLDWLTTVEKCGISLITGAPLHEGVLKQISERVGVLKTTHYGESFKVVTKSRPSNVAYTPKALGLHTDLPSLNYSPGLQMLHCIKQVQSEGGENTFSDSFRVAYDLKEENEELFEILRNTPINFDDKGEDLLIFHMKSRKPTIECNVAGQITKVNFNNQLRGSMLTLPVDQVKPLYRAMTKFEKMLNDEKYCIRYKMRNGDVACFHNFRVMHGRAGYTKDGERHLEGAYIDWDFLRSRRRVLQERLA